MADYKLWLPKWNDHNLEAIQLWPIYAQWHAQLNNAFIQLFIINYLQLTLFQFHPNHMCVMLIP